MARVAVVAVVSVSLGIAIAGNGCGGSSSSGGTGGAGGATANCSAATGPGSGDACNVIAARGACVTGTFSTAAPPAPAGGAFASGTYNLVSQPFYGTADVGRNFLPGVPFRNTYLLSDVTATSFTLDQVWTTGTLVARSHETAAVSEMTATFTQICPAPDGGIDWGGGSEFTATSDSITLFRSTTIGVLEVTVYNKAP